MLNNVCNVIQCGGITLPHFFYAQTSTLTLALTLTLTLLKT